MPAQILQISQEIILRLLDDHRLDNHCGHLARIFGEYFFKLLQGVIGAAVDILPHFRQNPALPDAFGGNGPFVPAVESSSNHMLFACIGPGCPDGGFAGRRTCFKEPDLIRTGNMFLQHPGIFHLLGADQGKMHPLGQLPGNGLIHRFITIAQNNGA